MVKLCTLSLKMGYKILLDNMGRGKGYDDVKANSLKGGRKKEEKEEKKTSDFQFQGPTSFHSIPRHLRGCRG